MRGIYQNAAHLQQKPRPGAPPVGPPLAPENLPEELLILSGSTNVVGRASQQIAPPSPLPEWPQQFRRRSCLELRVNLAKKASTLSGILAFYDIPQQEQDIYPPRSSSDELLPALQQILLAGVERYFRPDRAGETARE